MYNNKAAVAVKVNGKVLREFKDTVYIPFGSEYSILIKNLNTRRAIFNIFIDGDNIVPNGLVLNAGQEVDLQRAIRNGNLTEGNKFKFIERTGAVEEHRGIKLEDGLIRIEHQFEKVFKRQDGIQWDQVKLGQPYYGDYWEVSNTLRGFGTGVVYDSHQHPGVACSSMNMTAGSTLSASSATTQSFNAVPQNETGITVPGSKSEQKFATVSNFAVESEKHSMIIKLLGETADNKEVREPITVKAKPKCTTCGKQNKATSRFCSECGTALVIYA